MLEKLIWVLTIGLLLSINLNAQQRVELNLKNAPKGYMYLHKIEGDNHIKTDSAICANNKLIFNGNYESGMYYINQGMSAFSFLINEEEIKFSSDFASIAHHLKVIESKENRIWFKYLEKRNEVYQKLKMLKPITVWYDQKSNFYKQAVSEYNKVQEDFLNFLRTIPQETMIYDYAWADVKPKLVANISFEDQKDDLKPLWFQYVNWENEALVNSDILTNKLKDFLGLYNQNGLSRKQLQEEFKVAVEQVLPFATANKKVGKFVVEFLLKEFERFALDEVIVHVADIYATLGSDCEMEGSESELQARLKRYEQMSVGKIAPNFILPNCKGELLNLEENLGEKNLIVFWSSWCPHCLHLMPELKKFYAQSKAEGWNVITISLDKEKEELTKALQHIKPNYPVLCDYKKWNCKAAQDYNIHSTPTILVLDAKGKILGKPDTIKELKAFSSLATKD